MRVTAISENTSTCGLKAEHGLSLYIETEKHKILFDFGSSDNFAANAEKLGIDIDEKALARGAMLHDYYLYTFKETKMSPYRHGISHPETALKNASKRHRLTEKETNIIRSHMWPMTFLHPPMSREAVLVCLADKYCAVNEMLLKKHDLSEKKKRPAKNKT